MWVAKDTQYIEKNQSFGKKNPKNKKTKKPVESTTANLSKEQYNWNK